MDRFDELLERVTRRLRVDAELRLEVSHELRTHLEDSAVAFMAGGCGADEAAAHAIAAFGDENELAEQIWQANRRRVRVRQVVKWAARATLAPSAVVLAIALAWSPLVAWIIILQAWGSSSHRQIEALTHLAEHRMLNDLTPEQRFIFEQPQDHLAALAKARGLIDRYPNDPLYHAHYATVLIRDIGARVPKLPHDRARIGPAVESAVVFEALDRGAAVEPGNGYYDLLKGAVLLAQSTRVLDDESEASEDAFTHADAEGKVHSFDFPPVKITNPEAFKRGLFHVHQAAMKPVIESHVIDLAERRLGMLPPPRTLLDQLMRIQFQISVLLPHLHAIQYVAPAIEAEAIAAARRSDEPRARELLRDSRTIWIKAIRPSPLIVEFLMFREKLLRTIAAEGLIDRILQNDSSAERKRQYLHEQHNSIAQARAPAATFMQRMARAAALQQILTPASADLDRIDFAPGRRAEYAAADRLALAVFLALLLVPALLRAAAAVIASVRAPAPDPTFLFVGWRKLLRVICLAGFLPLGVYWAYAWRVPGAREFGLWLAAERVVVEYALVGAVVVILLRRLTVQAVRQRAVEVGRPLVFNASRESSRRIVLVGGVLATLAIAYVVAWHLLGDELASHRFGTGAGPPLMQRAGYLLAGAIGLYSLGWLFASNGRPRQQLPPAALNLLHRPIPLWVFLGVSVLAGLVAAALLQSPMLRKHYSYLITGAIGCGIAAAIVVTAMGARGVGSAEGLDAAGRRTVARSALPITLATIVCIGAGGGIVLRQHERAAVTRLEAQGPLYYELDTSLLRGLRDAAIDVRLTNDSSCD